jgi:hypothetical protein
MKKQGWKAGLSIAGATIGLCLVTFQGYAAERAEAARALPLSSTSQNVVITPDAHS